MARDVAQWLSTHHSYKEPRFQSQHPQSDSYPPVTPVPGALPFFSVLRRIWHTHRTQKLTQAHTHTHTQKQTYCKANITTIVRKNISNKIK